MTWRRRALDWTIRPLAIIAIVAGVFLPYQYFWKRNLAVVVEGQVYRSAYPPPPRVTRWIDRLGLKTVVNLRGPSKFASYLDERRAVEEAGARMVDIRFSKRENPSVPNLRKLIHTLETGERPMLLHCRGGADRTGVASMMARMALAGESYEVARRQLTLRHMHVGLRVKGELIEILPLYEAWCRSQGLSTDGWPRFRHWLMNVYYRDFYYVRIDAPREVAARPGEEMTISAEVVNASRLTIPAGNPKYKFYLTIRPRSAPCGEQWWHRGPKTLLPSEDIAPGESVEVPLAFPAPNRPGHAEYTLDMLHAGHAWFSQEGSPKARLLLHVRPAPE